MAGQIQILGFARDPREEPKAGDVVASAAYGRLIERAVIRVQHSKFAGKDFVSYRTDARTSRIVSIDAWRKWAALGAILKLGAS